MSSVVIKADIDLDSLGHMAWKVLGNKNVILLKYIYILCEINDTPVIQKPVPHKKYYFILAFF